MKLRPLLLLFCAAFSAAVAATTIRVWSDATSYWTSNNPVLAQGEIAHDVTTGRFRIGDGSTAYLSLDEFATLAEAVAAAPVQSVDGQTGAVDLSAEYEAIGAPSAELQAHDASTTAHQSVRLMTTNITDAGSMARQAADAVAITGGTISGLASLSVTDGQDLPGPWHNLKTGELWGTYVTLQGQTTRAMTDDDFRLVPFYTAVRRFFSELYLNISVAGTSTFRAAIYKWNAAHDGLEMVTNAYSGEESNTSTGIMTVEMADQVELAPGVYFLGIGTDTATTFVAQNVNAQFPLLSVQASSGLSPSILRINPWTYAAMPATISYATLTEQVSTAPPVAWFPVESRGSVTPPTPRITYDYLEDGVAVDAADDTDYPKIHGGAASDGGTITAEQRSKYMGATRNGSDLAHLAAVKAINPNLRAHRYVSGLGVNNLFSDTWPVSVPFYSTGASTNLATGVVFAGHWAYEPFTQLAAAITTAGQTSVSVDDGSRFVVGDYAVIYDDATNFTNAEHVRVTAIAGNTLTVERGYKSTAATHAIDSRIAVHARAGGTPATSVPTNWMMHQGSNCPQDGSGNRWNALFGAFWGANYQKDADYNTVSAVDGIIWDMDIPSLLQQAAPTVDTDNDGVTDNGFISGVNVWRAGMEAMYDALRAVDDTFDLVGGVKYSLGWGDMVGFQFEVYPRVGEGTEVGDYSELSGYYTDMMLNSAYRVTDDPGYQENMCKSPSALYGGGTTNKYLRFDMAMTWIAGGHFGTHTYNLGITDDPWWDEFSVDLTPGATYGHAVASNPSDESAALAATGWLGKPTGPAYRVYGTEMDPATNAVYSETFDSAITGWTGTNVTVSYDGADGNDSGNGSLATGTPTSIGSFINSVVKGNINVTLTPGSWYTLGFSAKCADWTHVQPAFVWPGVFNTMLVGPQWNRFVYSFVAPTPTGSDLDLHFRVGRDAIACKFDDLVIVPGNANLFRRDFDNGTVIANGTGASVTVNLDTDYVRITGTGQDDINDGSSVTGSITIDAWDAAILVNAPPT